MATSTSLACVIIDNNEIDIYILEHLVQLTGSLQLVASFTDAVQALDFLQSHPEVQLVLLDIDMPELTGLELVRMLAAPHPEIVIITSHRDHALDAFELHVADYLIKPVDYARFRKSIDLIVQRYHKPAAERQVASGPDPHVASGVMLAFPLPEALLDPDGASQDLFVKVNNRLVRLNFNDVLYIEAMSTYSVFVTPKQKYIVHLTLKSIAERLPFVNFRRVHRSYMVNTKLIDSIEDNVLTLAGHEVPLAKSYQEELYHSLRSL
ncbi:LytR/AlgR family response regulator transcription factor [Hymenobacter sp. BRD67]|uniref:LytR/AlgR family response regulator transcription factor n=1 Tax=Hymenobacter sp. BRD67 TaxID=2675877 RepID=UPI001566C0F9|nr:LytTR family DNA-binding domain-containing protein [Hymenobacter sp. BRD67]QKG53956.1 response regulator transcription factor [Hymenobacter sp. BRD67]